MPTESIHHLLSRQITLNLSLDIKFTIKQHYTIILEFVNGLIPKLDT